MSFLFILPLQSAFGGDCQRFLTKQAFRTRQENLLKDSEARKYPEKSFVELIVEFRIVETVLGDWHCSGSISKTEGGGTGRLL